MTLVSRRIKASFLMYAIMRVQNPTHVMHCCLWRKNIGQQIYPGQVCRVQSQNRSGQHAAQYVYKWSYLWPNITQCLTLTSTTAHALSSSKPVSPSTASATSTPRAALTGCNTSRSTRMATGSTWVCVCTNYACVNAVGV